MPDASVCTACGQRLATEDGFELYAPDAARVGEGYDPALYPEIAALEDRNFWFQARNRLIVHVIRRFCPDFNSLLEIGCGTGQVLRAIGAAFPAAHVSGSELFLEGLAFARNRVPAAHLMQMDATRIPFTNEFDVIGAFDVVEHIRNDEVVLSEIHRALKPRGKIILSVPQHPWLWSRQDELAHHVRRYRRGELERKLERCGFKIAYSTSFVALLLPAMVASRAARRTRSCDALQDLRIAPSVNALFQQVMQVELAMLRMGVRFPLGGSRFVVGLRED